LKRDLRMTRPQDQADFAFHCSTVMDKATGTNVRWNEHHKGYVSLCDGHLPMKTAPLDCCVTPETEAYALTLIKGNFARWTAQFEAQDKFPSTRSSPSKKLPRQRPFRPPMLSRSASDDANLSPNWLATMQLVWEQPAGTNNMARCYV